MEARGSVIGFLLPQNTIAPMHRESPMPALPLWLWMITLATGLVASVVTTIRPKPNTDTGGEFLRCLQGRKGGAACLHLRRPRQPFPNPYYIESRSGCYML
jgi:hypothetical protein